jgi:hypothetical protein
VAWIFAGACAVTLGAGVTLELSGNTLADRAGINGVVFGATILAGATALPEISSGIAAVRLGDHALALGDIFGGNAFQLCLFLVADLIAGSPVLPTAGSQNAWLASLGVALTAIFAMGVVIRPLRCHVRRPALLIVLGQPRFREPLLGAREPRLHDRLPQLGPVEPSQIRDPDQHRRIPVEVRRREEQAARIGEHELLRLGPVDAEHQYVVEPLARRRIERVGAAAALQAERLPVHAIRRAPVAGQLLRHLGHRESELVEVAHRRHQAVSGAGAPPRRRAGGAPSGDAGAS